MFVSLFYCFMQLGDLGISVSATKTYNSAAKINLGTVSHLPPEAWLGTLRKAKPSWDIFE